jgi:hypothetical protein
MPKAPYIPPHHNAPDLIPLKNFYTQDRPPQYVEPAIIPAQSSLIPNFNIMGRPDYMGIKSIHHISSLGIGESSKQNISSEHKGKPQRPPASANLLIDSEDRYTSLLQKFGNFDANGIPANDFIISRNQALLYGYFTRIGVTQIQLNYRVPTVIAGRNSQFLIENGEQASYQVNIPEGFYDASGLAQTIQAEVLALAGTPFPAFVCTYNPLNGGLQMNCATPFAIIPLTGTPYTLAQQELWAHTSYTIGATLNNSTPGTVQVLTPPNLIYTKYVDIVSNNLTKFQRVKDADTNLLNKTNVIARVYLTAPNTRTDPNAFGGPFNLCWDPNTPKMAMWSPNETINELDFRLYDEFGQLLYWSQEYNSEFQLTLLASET